jgi:type II secretion system protein H
MRVRRSHCPRGFTLVELLIVLALISILTGLVVAEMRGTHEEALLRSSGRKLIGVLGWSASQAVTTGLSHTVLIDAARHRFAVRAAAAVSGENPRIVEEGALDERIQVEVREPAREADPSEEAEEAPKVKEQTEGESMGEIRFHADGTAEPREVSLRDRAGTTIVLLINPITGRVRLEDGP